MSNTFFKSIRIFSTSGLVLLVFSAFASAATPTVRTASGANAAAIQAAVDQFRADLGGANNGVGNSFTSGRREINWDGVPDSASSPNFLAFNSFAGRGAIFGSVSSPNFLAANDGNNVFLLSADSNNPTNSRVRFGDLEPSYTDTFQTFSAERLFVALGSNVIEIRFVIPGTRIPATVSGFGAVLTDVDDFGFSFMQFYDAAGVKLANVEPAPASNGLTFTGVSFNGGERVAKVLIKLGNSPLLPGEVDGQNGIDVVATDDFIYGEPRAMDFHPGDADGDGVADARVFRPATGEWFTLNSGSNTISIEQFGLNGDVPVDGDFDGDRRADLAIFRPTEGSWFVKRSTDGTFITQAFGATGDKPVAGDYDKDGKTDIAVWRPSNGNYFVLRSSDNQSSFFAFPFGTNGDIPVMAGAQ